ncbi:hypothetical protein Tco_0378218 [Tanacetum coccineum]
MEVVCLRLSFLKPNDMVEKEVYNELSNRFLQLEKHCISLEISMQQKQEIFQSNKPYKNQESPKFCEFFEINDLKAQLQAKTTLICNLKNQIKSVKEASYEAKLKKEINVLETINIELESSMAKLLAENEKLNKENEHLKQTYKELYDSIKKTRIQTKDHNDSLIAQVNSKTVENADLKAQIQEKVFANAALTNKLRKLNGTSVDTKFAKPSILGKLFATQVDVNNVLSKLVTPYYLPKVREYVLAKPHHVIAPGSSRNSQEESYGLNDMAHNHYLEEARKKTQERNRNSKPSVMPSVRLQNTANGSTPNPKRTNQTSRSLSTSKSSFVKSHKTNNSNNPTEQKSHTQKPGRQIFSGHRFSPKKTSTVYEKTSLRSGLRWKPKGKIFTTVGLKWIPTGKLFDSCTSKVDSEPPNGSNDDITNLYECDQTLNVSADTLNLSTGLRDSNLITLTMASATTPSGPALSTKKRKLTKNHPLDNVIGDPSRPVSTRSQLQEHAIWCYFDANDNPIPFGGKRSG